MMASRCKPHHFLNQRLFLRLLVHVLIMTWHYSFTESAAPIQLRGEIGGDVTFDCPVNKQKTITFFYFQKGNTYVNGYYTKRKVESPTWENTRLDRDKTAVHMYLLKVSHSGDYQCHIQYNDSLITHETVINLSVTAKFSKPEVTKSCTDETFNLVKCSSHGGYPGAKVMWNVSGTQMWKVVNSSEMEDPDTMTFNSSSTAFFNCSNGELKSLSCSVGNVSSDPFSVCAYKDIDPSSLHWTIAAICGVVLFTIIVILLLCWKCKKRRRVEAVL